MSAHQQAVSDEDLARQAQTGNPAAFGELVERYEAKLRRYAKKFLFDHEDSQDLVQEAFLKAWANLRGFDTSRKFSSWVYRIAHNEFINAIRRKGREPLPFFDPDTIFPHPVDPKKADDNLKSEELKQQMESCLGRLVPKYREVLVLYYFEMLDYQSIADILRVPASTVGVRLRRARAALQAAWTSQENSSIKPT